MNLPRPGAPQLDNLCATLLIAGNRSHMLNLDRIAQYQRLDPIDLKARFLELETHFTLQPQNSFEEGPFK